MGQVTSNEVILVKLRFSIFEAPTWDVIQLLCSGDLSEVLKTFLGSQVTSLSPQVTSLSPQVTYLSPQVTSLSP